MIPISPVLAYLVVGVGVGLILLLLRRCIDRRKGALAEFGSVAAVMLTAALLIFLISRSARGLEFGPPMASVVKLVFFALPILAIIRLAERWLRGERIQVVDLLRLTTVVALPVFVYATFVTPVNFESIAVAVFVFWMAEHVALGRGQTGWRRWVWRRSTVLMASFLAAVFVEVLTGKSILNSVADLDLGKEASLRNWTGVAGVFSMLVGIIAVPIFYERWARHSPWFHRLVYRLAALRFSLARGSLDIYSTSSAPLWNFRPGTCFLNHGSFGAVPLVVQDAQQAIQTECQDQPMEFLARRIEKLWLDARFCVATWLGTKAENLAFCENATAGMNEIAAWFPLDAGDEVLLNDHEYGAVKRIWQRRCEGESAVLVTVELPMPFTLPEAIVEAILDACTDRTRLVVLSHITSPTAVRLPVEQLCEALRERGIATCIDGPHAVLQEPLKLSRLGCDFYTASCHKWLCAPIGSGFVYVDPKWHEHVRPARLSWGRVQPTVPEHWSDELLWTGTRDHSPYLTVPSAIRFFDGFPYKEIDARNHRLASYARQRISELPGAEPVTPEGREWYGWLVGVWLPPGEHSTLQKRLVERYQIEVPIVHFADRWLVRVSCHLYNTTADIDFLARAIAREMQTEKVNTDL